MTYQDLLNELSQLTEEQLRRNVVTLDVFDITTDYSEIESMIAFDISDVNQTQPYLSL